MTNLDGGPLPTTKGFRRNHAYDQVFLAPDLESARTALLNAAPKDCSEEGAYGEFLQYLRSAFTMSERNIVGKIWVSLQEDPHFESAVIAYLKKMVPEIFKNKYSRSLYEDIEFGLFLLGSSESFDVLEDIRDGGVQGISGLFAKRHSAISRGLASSIAAGEEDQETARERWNSFERKVEGFEQLCEIINKIAAMHSISALDKDRALSLIRMIAAQIEVVGGELERIGHDRYARDKLRFIEGKLLGNYSHLEFFDGRSSEEICRKADKICESIEKGFELQKITRFGGVPRREDVATLVKLGNLGFVRLMACQKSKRFGPLGRDLAMAEKEWTGTLFSLYAKAAGSPKAFSNANDVALDFVERKDHDEFMIETIHHLTLFCEIPADTLCRITTKLIGESQYSNAFHEEFKIKLFSVILEKLRSVERSERTARLAYWIREYARKNEKVSGLVMSFSQLYVSLAAFLSSLGTEAAKQSAMECYLRASRVTDERWQMKFEGQENLFFNSIGGRSELERFEKFHTVEKEREIHGQFLALIAKVVNGTKKDEANRAVCEIIEEFFHGICTAEIRTCVDCERLDFSLGGGCDADCVPPVEQYSIRRGNRYASIAIGQGHYLILQYPANLETVFNRILDQKKDFIRSNLASLLAIVMKDRELSETNRYLADANARLDRQIRTDSLTRLPNMRQYEDDLPLFKDLPEVSSLLLKVENLSEVNGAYGIDTGNEFVKEIADGPIREFFEDGGERWKIYRPAPKEFLIIGNCNVNQNGSSFTEIIPYFHNLCSIFTFFPKAGTSFATAREGIGLRARISISYSDQLKTDIYKNLHIAIQDAQMGCKMVAFDEATHSEDRLRKNLEGGTIVTEAIYEKRIVPYYQAIVNNRTGRVEKYECLARLENRDGSILPPVAFIDHAKRAGTIPLLTRLMFERTCDDLGRSDTAFSINISWQDLADPDLIRDLIETMDRYEIEPGRVTFEILEEALLSNRGGFAEKIAVLKRKGCKIALDDF